MKSMFIVLFCFYHEVSAQVYKPIDTADYALRKQFAANFKASNEKLVAELKQQYPGRTGTELAKIYKEFTGVFIKDIYHKDYSFLSGFDVQINRIIAKLRENNPTIPGDIKVLIARENTPNAMCLADGTFIINMGLIYWVDNEAELAAILSHEMSHRLLQHSLQDFLKEIASKNYDKTVVEKLKTEKDNRQNKAFSLLRETLYKKRSKNRKIETEADSLGYRLYKNTAYIKAEYINSLKTLEQFDSISPKELKVETYRKLFNLPTKPFNEKWLQKEDFTQYNYGLYKAKLDKDSLSTHPEIPLRIQHLQKLYPELLMAQKPAEPDAEFKKIQKTAQMEALPNLYHSENYGAGIYSALQSLQDGEEENFNKEWLGKFFTKLYQARKDYTLNRYLERVNPKQQSESYQQFLSFMWNLSLNDLKDFADYFSKK